VRFSRFANGDPTVPATVPPDGNPTIALPCASVTSVHPEGQLARLKVITAPCGTSAIAPIAFKMRGRKTLKLPLAVSDAAIAETAPITELPIMAITIRTPKSATLRLVIIYSSWNLKAHPQLRMGKDASVIDPLSYDAL